MPKLIFALIIWMSSTQEPPQVTWDELADVKFTRRYFKESDAHFLYPTFDYQIRMLEGKEIVIKGYVLAIDPKKGYYILSRNPYASCFFCGAAGPESIMELNLKPGHRRYKNDQVATFKGILKLNENDVDHCNYILEGAEEVR